MSIDLENGSVQGNYWDGRFDFVGLRFVGDNHGGTSVLDNIRQEVRGVSQFENKERTTRTERCQTGNHVMCAAR